MPVIWRDNADHVDVIPFEHLAIVGVGIGFSFAEFVIVLRSFGVPRIDIADGEDVTEVCVTVSIASSHAADTDAADTWPVILLLIGERLLCPRKILERTGGGDRRCGLQKIASSGVVGSHRHRIIPFFLVFADMVNGQGILCGARESSERQRG